MSCIHGSFTCRRWAYPSALLACSLVCSTLAVPIVVFGAVSLFQQAQQANEDKALRMKAILTHNAFLSQDEDAAPILAAEISLPSPSNIASKSASNQRSIDDPDAAAPAMLDQPERPEPSIQLSPGSSSTDAPVEEQKPARLPPQTAVLDRPDRPEPDVPPYNARDATAPQLQLQLQANTGGIDSSTGSAQQVTYPIFCLDPSSWFTIRLSVLTTMHQRSCKPIGTLHLHILSFIWCSCRHLQQHSHGKIALDVL